MLSSNFRKLDLNKFCKLTLGVNKKGTNCALFHCILKLEERLLNLDNKWLVHDAFIEGRKNSQDTETYNPDINSWHNAVTKLHTLCNPELFNVSPILEDKYSQVLTNFTEHSSRLKFYRSICHPNYEIPDYTCLRPDLRQAFMKIR